MMSLHRRYTANWYEVAESRPVTVYTRVLLVTEQSSPGSIANRVPLPSTKPGAPYSITTLSEVSAAVPW